MQEVCWEPRGGPIPRQGLGVGKGKNGDQERIPRGGACVVSCGQLCICSRGSFLEGTVQTGRGTMCL